MAALATGVLVLLSTGCDTRPSGSRPQADLGSARSRLTEVREARAWASPARSPAFVATLTAIGQPESGAGNRAAEQAYYAAVATFRARGYGQAVLDFLDFITRYPHHPLVGNAQYWIGEAYYAQRDYRQALTEFQRVGTVAPGSPKVADALLRAGFCHRRLRDDARARQTWQRLIQDFPRSEAAAKARALLRPETGAAQR
jgi:tol-pal system protein YbgF